MHKFIRGRQIADEYWWRFSCTKVLKTLPILFADHHHFVGVARGERLQSSRHPGDECLPRVSQWVLAKRIQRTIILTEIRHEPAAGQPGANDTIQRCAHISQHNDVWPDSQADDDEPN
jgi:hypothetical protein